MILVSLALLGFAVADLLSLGGTTDRPAATPFPVAGAAATTAAVAALTGFSLLAVVLVGLGTSLTATAWLRWSRVSIAKRLPPAYPLACVFGVVLVAFAASGAVQPVSGPLADWYTGLHFPGLRSPSIDQFLLGAAAALFLLATGNQIVRLVLEAAGTPAAQGENTLKGGRFLGPMERLFVAAMVLAGDVTGAAIIIAAKGLLRLPEIRTTEEEHKGQGDLVTEYFLIGTFSSLLLAGSLAVLVLAAG